MSHQMERNIQGRNENLPQITIDPKVWLSLCSYRQDVEEHDVTHSLKIQASEDNWV